MNTEDDDLDIEIPENPAAEEDAVEVVKAGEAGTVDDGIEALKQQLATEKAERAAAEARASREATRGNEAEERAHRATAEARDSNFHLVSGAIEQLKATQDILEERYADAAAAGDHRTMAKITREFSVNSAKLNDLEVGKQEMERAPKEEPQRRQILDPVEQMASQMEQTGSHRSARWIRDHPEYARDPNMTRKMLAAHNMAVSDGLKADSEEYFNEVESLLKIRGNSYQEDSPETPRQRQSPPPAAPSSRSSSTTGGSNNRNRVRLTSEEVEMAEMMGMSAQEYAKNKVELQKVGKLN